MKREEIQRLEYGAAKNGAVFYLIESANCILLEWKGDVLYNELQMILQEGLRIVEERQLTGWIGNTVKLGILGEDSNEYIINQWMPSAAAIGLLKLAVVLPEDVFGEFTVTEIMDNISSELDKQAPSFQSTYFKSEEEAFEWISQ